MSVTTKQNKTTLGRCNHAKQAPSHIEGTQRCRIPLVHLSFTYRSPIAHLSFTYRSPIAHLSFTYRSPIVHLSFTYRSPIAHLSFTYCSPIAHLSFTYRSPIAHLSFTYRSPIVHLSFTYRSPIAHHISQSAPRIYRSAFAYLSFTYRSLARLSTSRSPVVHFVHPSLAYRPLAHLSFTYRSPTTIAHLQYSCGSIFFYICSIASHRTLLLSLSMNLQQLKKLCCWMEWQRKQKENR